MDGLADAQGLGQRFERVNAVVDGADSDASGGLGLIVRDLARALGADITLLAVAGPAPDSVKVLAAWGAAASGDGVRISLLVDGIVGRALSFERAAVEPLDAWDGDGGAASSERPITHVLGAPVRPLVGPGGVLCAAFSTDPSHELTTTLWLAEGYARLASMCLQDRDTLDGLLPGGRVDGLTGCLTQVAFMHELDREIARSERHGRQLCCAFIDLDDFKRVNDRYGHLHGSHVLANIAAVLRAGIRSEDTLCRYGGDEFVLLLPDTDETAATELARRLRTRISRTMINLPHDPIDASIGVAQWRPGSTSRALLGAADEALLAAKSTGGGTVTSASMLRATRRSSELSGAAPEDQPDTSDTISVKDVLDVLAYFHRSGGASIDLAAWELTTEPTLVATAWSQAIREGFLERAGTDRETGEEMWRLSDRGHRASQTAG